MEPGFRSRQNLCCQLNWIELQSALYPVINKSTIISFAPTESEALFWPRIPAVKTADKNAYLHRIYFLLEKGNQLVIQVPKNKARA